MTLGYFTQRDSLALLVTNQNHLVTDTGIWNHTQIDPSMLHTKSPRDRHSSAPNQHFTTRKSRNSISQAKWNHTEPITRSQIDWRKIDKFIALYDSRMD